MERREVTVEIGSLDADDENTVHWAPSGNAVLKAGGQDIVFMPNGLIKDPSSNTVISTDTTFEICDNTIASAKASKQISISKMGTIQLPVDGDCT